MLRTSGLPACPPLARTTALRARMRIVVARLFDVAVLPEAAHQLTGLRVHARRILGLDADDTARERLLAHEVGEFAEQHELHALLARRELERARQCSAVRDGTLLHEAARDVHLHGCEGARALAVGDAGILGRDRAGLDVGLVAEHQEAHGAARTRHAAAFVRAVDAAEAHVVVHQELARRAAVLGPRAHQLALVVAIRRLAAAVQDRPVRDVGEQQIDAVVELLGRLDGRARDEPFLVALAFLIAELERIAAAQRDERAAVQHAAAEIEVLIDDEHGGAEIAGPDRGREPGAAAAGDDDVEVVIPGGRAALAIGAARFE